MTSNDPPVPLGVCASALVTSSLASKTAVSVNAHPFRTAATNRRARATRAGRPSNTRDFGIARPGEHGPASIVAMSLIRRLATDSRAARQPARWIPRMSSQEPRARTCTLRANRRIRTPSRILWRQRLIANVLPGTLRCCAVCHEPGHWRGWIVAGLRRCSQVRREHARFTATTHERPMVSGVDGRRLMQSSGRALGRPVWLERICTGTPLAFGARSPGSSRNGAPCVVAPNQRP
jgi:hypothetical protein